MKFTVALKMVVLVLLLFSSAAGLETVRLSRSKYVDKCKGAWAGQMIGVCYGCPYEFKSRGKPITNPLEPWRPERIEGAIEQDDCYVEITFLKALEKYGLDIAYQEAGKEFADSRYNLWHANCIGRENIRHGIMPPESGHPRYNRHADDIDFQIEADLLGILCPGLPQASNRLCDIFGHIMNYGDGVYGGMFVAGMYTAAYLEDNDIHKVIQVGLDCIPAESQYHKCISDVIGWHKENPHDWLATWKRIEEKWNDDIDCRPGEPYNIDAKLNGAYIVMGLLYGQGDFLKTMEISTRCGQDADCNPSSAAGVLGCMKGYNTLGVEFAGGIPAIEDKKFSFTDYTFKTLIVACQDMTEKILRENGCKITDNAYMITRQESKAPEQLEQWTDQMEILSKGLKQYDVDRWESRWKMYECGNQEGQGFLSSYQGRQGVLAICPISRERPAIMTANFMVPKTGQPKLNIEASSHLQGGFLIKAFLNSQPGLESVVDTQGKWTTKSVDVSSFAGRDLHVRLQIYSGSQEDYSMAYFDKIEVK